MRLKLTVIAAALTAIGLTGCGYPADPLPPALNRPRGVRDLAAVERGSKIIVHFTMPVESTEGLPMKRTTAELRAGILPGGRFDLGDWERTSEQLSGTEFDIAKYTGQTIAIAVRVKGPRGQSEGWSNFVALTVVPALPTPEGLEAADAADAIRLEWHAAAPLFRVFRRDAGAKEWTLLGTSEKPSYTDSTIVYGSAYEYLTQAIEKAGEGFAESELSTVVSFKPVDKFPPAVPTGVTAIPGTRTIELLWERNTEKDLAAYRIYRDDQKVADALPSPAWSDKEAKPGVKYRYQVSAVDTAGNESARSAAVEATLP